MAPPAANRELDPGRQITVVSGLPRSGTSMMMQMLEAAGLEIASDERRAADADNPRGYYELDAVKRIRKDASFLRNCVGRVVKVVAPLLPSLPGEFDYRIVFMERDLDEVLASQRVMLERSAATQAIAREGKEARVEVEDEPIRRAYLGQLENVKTWIATQPNVEILFVFHRHLIERPKPTLSKVIDFLDSKDGGQGRAADREEHHATVEAMRSVIDRSLCRQLAEKGELARDEARE